MAALLADWLIRYGLTLLALGLGTISVGMLLTVVLVIWFVVGVVAAHRKWLSRRYSPTRMDAGCMISGNWSRGGEKLGLLSLRVAVICGALSAASRAS